ncbi:hypothetical protein CEP51_014806 [Fusarium floridanum]|uniref:Uncharacterized protein n=1 Tax=Fusarium floridanum TaxID=1325733 RepID=A0A428PLK9_9HYPO|nr:hypothetical protein CEP51_014806 [Fusarium floridanum]
MVIRDDESATTAPVDCPPEAPADCPPETSVGFPSEAPVDCPPETSGDCPPVSASVTEWLAHSLEDCPHGHRYPPPQNEATASVSDEDDKDSKKPTTACLPFRTNTILLSYFGEASTAFLKRRVAQSFIPVLQIIAIIASFLFTLFLLFR